MRNFKLLMIWIFFAVTLTNCELPEKPDFQTSHRVETPLIVNKTFQFLGGDGETEALIDTTKGDMDSLFIVDQDPASSNFGLITISKEQDFDFGNLDDAIPTVSVEGTSFNAAVGEIEIGSLSSSTGNLGEASFEALTGQPNSFESGDPVPPQPVVTPEEIIDLNTDFFTSATFKSGALDIVLENNLGYDLSNVHVTLVSDPNPAVFGDETDVSNDDTGPLIDSDQATVSLPFSNGDELYNPQVRVSIDWNTPQSFNRTPESLVVISANGNNLIASEVLAAVEAQDFSTSNLTVFDDTEFRFSDPSHYAILKTGTIDIAEIVNEMDMDIDSLIISFPDIRRSPNLRDSLRIRYIDTEGIRRGTGAAAKQRDLEGYYIFALNNEVRYNIYAVTENTQNAPVSDQTRVINELQEITSTVEINNLTIDKAYGEIVAQEVLLGDDNDDDRIDLFDDNEAEITEISGLEDFSSQIEGLEFTESTLSIIYTSNVGVPTTIYGAFLGVSENDEIFLTGEAEKEVQPGDPIQGLYNNGQPLLNTQLIKFIIPASPEGTTTGEVLFDKDNSNVNEFLNNLPTEIRFVSKSIVNESGSTGNIDADSLDFSPSIAINLPLAFRTSTAATFSDTTEVDFFKDFPSTEKGDDADITEGTLVIAYENALPLGFDLEMTFIDSLGNEVTSLPGAADLPYDISGGAVGADKFIESPSTGSFTIAFTPEQLRKLYQTHSLVISARLRTTDNSDVKVRAEDTISLSIGARISAITSINFND